MKGPYYLVMDDRGEEAVRFVVAQFSKWNDADAFAGDVGGEIVTASDGGDVAELIDAWHAGDFSRQARVEAGQMIADWFHALGNAPSDPAGELVESYAESDDLCALALKHLHALAELKAALNDVVPPDAKRFYGVHVRGPWRLSQEAVEEIGQAAAAEAMEEAAAAVAE